MDQYCGSTKLRHSGEKAATFRAVGGIKIDEEVVNAGGDYLVNGGFIMFKTGAIAVQTSS